MVPKTNIAIFVISRDGHTATEKVQKYATEYFEEHTHSARGIQDIKEEDVAICLFGIGTNKQLLDRLDPHAVDDNKDKFTQTEEEVGHTVQIDQFYKSIVDQ